MKITIQEHPVTIEINGTPFSIEAGLSLSDVERIYSDKEQDSNSIVAGIIASKINEKYSTNYTKEQIIAEEDTILPVFLKSVPHLKDSSSVGFLTADELVIEVKDYCAELSPKLKNKLPEMPDYSSLFMPSPERIKAIGDSLRYEQERKFEEHEARESTKETAYNTAELLKAISEMQSDNRESSKKQKIANRLMIAIGVLTFIATIVFGIFNIRNRKQNVSIDSSTFSNVIDSNLLKEDTFDGAEVPSVEFDDINETRDE